MAPEKCFDGDRSTAVVLGSEHGIQRADPETGGSHHGKVAPECQRERIREHVRHVDEQIQGLY